MRSPSPRRRVLAGLSAIAFTLTLGSCPWAHLAAAIQDAPKAEKEDDKEKAKDKEKDKAAGVFDDEKDAPKPDAKKAAPAKPADAKAKAAGATAKPDDKKPSAATERDTIGFSQENAAAQMTELEERMFRLSEALRGLEPENASRLRLALKFSREELILEQMRETHKLLKDAQLGKAETEVRELLAKLEHLRDLLLAEDLDFQLKLARLRQMRETLGQLERIIKEERRELGWSRFVVDQRKELDRLAQRRPDVAALVKDQEAAVADTRAAVEEHDETARGKAVTAVRRREADLRGKAAGLATDPLFADLQPPHLNRAGTHLGDALDQLGGAKLDAAVAAEQKALDALREELARADARIAEATKAVAEAEFRRHQADQAKNRGASAVLGEVSARLGDAGVALQKDLIRAGASMQSAEGHLAKTAAESAATDEEAALETLDKSRDDLSRSIERLLVEIRTELQSRLIAEITEMHESQASIRETTAAQAPRVAQKSRTALIQLSALSKKEGELGERTSHLLALVEETEFGIALPTTLRVLAREMRSLSAWLKDGDATERTIALEQRVEDDLLALLQAIRRLPPTTPPAPGEPFPTEPRARERELNRLVAELKMVRLLQFRLNDDTTRVDGARPGDALPADLRREVEGLESSQEEIRDSLARIAERLEAPLNNEP